MSRRDRFVPQVTAIAEEGVPTLRLGVFGGAIGLIFVLLLGRLWVLQIARGEEYREQAEENRSRKTRTAAPRGVILDSTGKPLVTNAAQFTVYLRTDEVPHQKKRPKTKPRRKGEKPVPPPPDLVTEAYYDRLAQLLGIERAELDKTIKARKGRASDPIPVAQGIDRHMMARIYEHADDVPAISVEVEPVRTYPEKTRATHVLGYTASISADELTDPKLKEYPAEKAYRGGDMIGRSGIEKQYDKYLRGSFGNVSFEVDAQGRLRNQIGEEAPTPGATLTLSLRSDVQEAAEKALGGRPGAVVAIDPRDGRVLAMASAPTYDLNLRTQRFSKEIYKKLIGPGETNRAISPFMPGSTMKIVTSAAGLGEGKITEETGFLCNHGMFIGKDWKKCHSTHGGVSLNEALAQSCDVYYYQTGMRLGSEKLAVWGHKFGLGEDLHLDLPVYARSKGVMPDAAYKKRWAESWNRRFKSKVPTKWLGGDTANAAIGQGFLTATPVQVATIAAAIANGGTVYEPRLVLKATAADDPNNVLYQMQPTVHSTLGLKKSDIDAIRRGMRSVITSGTGKGAQIGGGIDVYGKSGSAEKAGGFDHGATFGWFTSYAQRTGQPAEIAVCIFLEPTKGENYHGGAIAAPLAKQVILAYYGGTKKPSTASQSSAMPL